MSDDFIDVTSKDPSEEPSKGPGFTITAMWAFVAVDDAGAEGIMAMSGMTGGREMLHPLITSNPDHLEGMRQVAIKLGRKGRKAVRLVRFNGREDLGIVWEP